MGNYKFIISGGGTGGHIYPAIAIADELKKRYPNAAFLFVGAKDRMEMEKVPQAGYEIEGLWISGIQRKLTLKNLLFPIKLINSLWRSRSIVKSFKPNVVVGTGGFASGPLLKMASSNGVSCVLQEQNSFAGITNKLLASKAKKICVAYDGMEQFFPANKIVKTGNPVRADLLEIRSKREEAISFFDLDKDKKTILVLGGSLGARRVNQLVEKQLSFFDKHGFQLLWQCGKLYENAYKGHSGDTVKVLPFVNRMDLAYAAADIVISRAGAGSVSELSIVGKPVLFIPSPNVAEDHQTKNAEAIVKENAAVMIKEANLDQEFESVFENEFLDSEKLLTYGQQLKKLAKPNATAEIVNEIVALLK